jgi:putative component of membrane protein insertase Oxa1/YidC/SpoIIIJ protein YidD
MKTSATIFACLLAVSLSAQSNHDFTLLETAFQPISAVKLTDQFQESRKNPNEIQAIMSGLFLFYKTVLSSQDQNRCNFHPSCSEFGLHAVKTFGLFRGVICTFDRLSRCNGLSPELYEVDVQKKLLLDPVKW